MITFKYKLKASRLILPKELHSPLPPPLALYRSTVDSPTLNQRLPMSYLTLALMSSWSYSDIHSKPLRESTFQTYSDTQSNQCSHTAMRNGRSNLD